MPKIIGKLNQVRQLRVSSHFSVLSHNPVYYTSVLAGTEARKYCK